MLFGRKKAEPPERVEVEGLTPLLNGLFDASLRDFSARCDRSVQRLDSDWESFRRVYESFREDGTAPDLEDLRSTTIETITQLKSNYVKALQEVHGREQAQEQHATAYERCRSSLEWNEYKRGQVLQINHRFRPVMIAYANRLDSFKRVFSEIERHLMELKAALDGARPGFNRYVEVRNSIDELQLHLESIDGLREDVRCSARYSSGNEEPVSGNAEEAVNAAAGRLREAEGRIARQRSLIAGLVKPLERAAKKYDHANPSKDGLEGYLTDPGRISGAYARFLEMLDSLATAMDDSTIDLKNSAEVHGMIAEIKRSNVKIMVDELSDMERERDAIAGELAVHDRRLKDDRARVEAKEARKRESEELSRQLEAAEGRKLELKSGIEGAFLSSYGKRIEVGL